MLKKYFIVNNYDDLFSGKVIPHKVLDYMPVGSLNPIMPMPITKTQELVVSPGLSPVFPLSPLMSPMSPYEYSYTTRTPLVPSAASFTTGLSGNRMPFNNMSYGPPIIKMSPLMNNNSPARINITSDNNTWILDVPYVNIRGVWDYIWQNAQQGLNPTDPKVNFRFNAPPTYDFNVPSTFNKMKEIVKGIESNYSNVRYMTPGGNLTDLAKLTLLLNNGGFGINSPLNVNRYPIFPGGIY